MLSVTMAALNAAQKEMNVTANNLANASTVGFKRSYANFGDVFSNDPAANPKTAVGAGVLTSSISRDTTAGALKSTGRVTDLAIDGRGMFITRDPAGTANTYSRAGNFGLDANGYIVDPGGFQLMGFETNSGGNASSLKAMQVPTQFVSGDTLPDGTTIGRSVQLVTFDGPATATGFITVGGENIPITNGDSSEQIAINVQRELAQAPSFSGRSVSIVGSGNSSQLKIVFGASETVTTPITIGIPAAISPSAQFTTNSATIPEIQKISYYAATNNLHFDNTAVINDGTNTITIPVPADAPIAETVRAFLSDPDLAPSFVGRTVSLDPTNSQNLLIQFGTSEGYVAPISIAGTHGAEISITQSYQNIPNIEQITALPASADGMLDVAGVSVPVISGESAATIANRIQTALAQAFPARSISRSNDTITMTYLVSEGNASLVQPKLTLKKPASGRASLVSSGSEKSIILQGISISPKGEVQATYSNNKTYTMGYLGIATFPNDGGLKAIGSNRFAETGLSGAASLTPAGAPKAGNIMAGTLEQANVDITTELMDMIRAQQVYNGNARMMQTTIETVQRITDRI